MAEVSFAKEIESLRLGAGETFYGEGILAVTKALLQSGVAYVGGYQGAPVSHLLDVLVQSEDLLADLGIHLETCTNEAAAAAMLGASINYPLRGAVTWKSIVGTNVAADALSNLASPGVQGGALIIVGEDYGEGASVIQERTHAFALKSSLWLIDPRPDLPTLVRAVEKGFELSEALQHARHPRAAHPRLPHVRQLPRQGQRGGPLLRQGPPGAGQLQLRSPEPSAGDLPPGSRQVRAAAARGAEVHPSSTSLNERMGPADGDIGIIVQGGLFNVLNGRLALAGLSDVDGTVALPTLVLNVVHPLVPDEIATFCAGKKAVLIVEEGAPDFLEQAIGQILRKADLNTRLIGKDLLPMAGEYTPLVVGKGLAAFCARYGRARRPSISGLPGSTRSRPRSTRPSARRCRPRPPTFCTGCPERPVFSAMKLLRQEMGRCMSRPTSAATRLRPSRPSTRATRSSATACRSPQPRRCRARSRRAPSASWATAASGITASSPASPAPSSTRTTSVLVVMNNGYSSATGQQDILSSKEEQDGRGKGLDIEAALKSLGVPWIKRVRTYGVAGVVNTLREALRTGTRASRSSSPTANASSRASGASGPSWRRWWRPASAWCVRASGSTRRCARATTPASASPAAPRSPSSPTRTRCAPIPSRTSTMTASAAACAARSSHAAQLCPSFAQIDIIQNPSLGDRLRRRLSAALIRLLRRRGAHDKPSLVPAE